jgi:hypothetical protein
MGFKLAPTKNPLNKPSPEKVHPYQPPERGSFNYYKNFVNFLPGVPKFLKKSGSIKVLH